MYCQFYGLKERPFNVTSDPNFFFLSRHHKEALSHLFYGTSQRKGIIVVTGEIGTGKTTLCRFFLNRLENNYKTAFIFNPYSSETQLLDAILRDFGLNVKVKPKISYMWEFNRFLLKEAGRGNNVVLIVDEAQNLSPRQLEQVRLLSNLETEKDKLMQIILVGQPELKNRLDLYELRQIQQRITVRYHIMPLEKDELQDYIQHRINVAGGAKNISFSGEALEDIWDFSCGVPRLVNILCDRALLAGFVAETHSIDGVIIKRCVEELGTYFAKEAQ